MSAKEGDIARLIDAVTGHAPWCDSPDWQRPFSASVEDGMAIIRDARGRPMLFANPHDFWCMLLEVAD